MIEITELFLKFRQCRLALWNHHLSKDIVKPEHAWGSINAALTLAYFAGHGGNYDASKGQTNLLMHTKLNPKCFFNRQKRAWQELPEDYFGEVNLVFIDFFDFVASNQPRHYEYVYCCEPQDPYFEYLIKVDGSQTYWLDPDNTYRFCN